MFKPLIPVITDGFSHTFNEAAHISTVHAKDGKDHAHAEVAKAGADEQKGKDQKILPSTDQVPCHLSFDAFTVAFYQANLKNVYGSPEVNKLLEVCVLIQIPPPRFS